ERVGLQLEVEAAGHARRQLPADDGLERAVEVPGEDVVDAHGHHEEGDPPHQAAEQAGHGVHDTSEAQQDAQRVASRARPRARSEGDYRGILTDAAHRPLRYASTSRL